MEYAIALLDETRKHIERHFRQLDLMQTDRKRATEELNRMSQLKKAIKILKQKTKKL